MTTHASRLSFALPLAAAIFGGGCVAPGSPPGSLGVDESSLLSRRAFERDEHVDVKALARLDHGDGTWSFALPAAFDPSVKVKGGVITWCYEGQARFPHTEKPSTGMRRYVAREDQPKDRDRQLAGLTRVDRLGRIWKVASIDQAALARLEAPNPVETEAPRATVRRALEPDHAPGTVVDWKPLSWTHFDCESGNGNEVHLWDGESRTIQSPVTNARQKTAVRVRVDLPNTTDIAKCTGTLVASNQVLTAAHCVSDEDSNPRSPSRVTVCREDTGECLGASDVDFSTAYHGGTSENSGTDFDDDWAIIELDGSWSSAPQTMALSSAGDSVLQALTKVRNIAFPGWAPECTDLSGETLISNVENEPFAGITSGKLKMKIDGAPGHSGSPIFYCPDDDDDECLVGEQGFVIGVFAGWDSVADRHVAAKVSSFRSAALAFIND